MGQLPDTAVLPNTVNLARTVNRFRQQRRPSDPKNLRFELDQDHIPEDFLQGDISVGIKRHLIFATPHMLQLLAKAKDGTWTPHLVL